MFAMLQTSHKTTLACLAVCSALLHTGAHAGGLSVTVLDKEGKPTADAVVVLVPSNKGAPKTALVMQTTIAQEKMQFIPSVSVVGVGAKIRFVNNDPWDHHIRSSAAGAAQFSDTKIAGAVDLRLEGKSEGKASKSMEVTMDKAGAQTAVLLGCYLHGSMRGHVYVSDSPWASKTGADGVAKFDDVPDGSVQVRVWHGEQLIDLPAQQINLASADQKLNVQLQIVPRRRAVQTPAKNYY